MPVCCRCNGSGRQDVLLETKSNMKHPIIVRLTTTKCLINVCPTLPKFRASNEPKFTWGTLSGAEMTIDNAIVTWRRNVFLIPSGKAGKAFVVEIARLIRSYAEASTLESIALKAVVVMQALLLQKPHTRSRAREHSEHLSRRLYL